MNDLNFMSIRQGEDCLKTDLKTGLGMVPQKTISKQVHYKQTFFSASRPLPAEMTYTAKMTVAIVENMLSRKCDPKTKQNKNKKQNKTFG